MKIGGLAHHAAGGRGIKQDHLRELQLFLQEWAERLNW